MFSLRYIHAADLHLDAAFKGLGRATETQALAEQLRAATFTALDRLVTLCEKEKPDFLVLAGDIYNEEDQSLKAQLHLRDACQRLNTLGIKVFIAHGNHDPLSSRLQMLSWPENTITFDDTVQSHAVRRKESGEIHDIAIVHGISHASGRESRNLAKAFSRLSASDKENSTQIFQLGVLHCTLENALKADRYAPCSLDDLKTTGLDAWALGHVHEGRVINEDPFVAYSGNTQGLHINESGAKGCLVVNVSSKGAGQVNKFEIESKFHTLSPVIWQCVDVALDDVDNIDEILQRISQSIEQATASADPECTTLILRIRLSGRLELDHELRKPDTLDELLERIRQHTPSVPLVWIKDIVVATSALQSLETLSKRDDLLGETLRLAQDINNNDEILQNFMQTSLAQLYTHPKAKHILEIPQGEDAKALLNEAQRLCADMMESR